MLNVAEVSSRQRTTSPGALTRVELELELPPEVSACAFAIDDLPAAWAVHDELARRGAGPAVCRYRAVADLLKPAPR